MANQDEQFEQMDLEMQPWRDFVAAWAERYGTRAVAVAELYEVVRQHNLLAEELPDEGKGDRSRQTRLGMLLRQYKDKVISGWRLRSRYDGKRAVHRLEPLSVTAVTAAAPAADRE